MSRVFFLKRKSTTCLENIFIGLSCFIIFITIAFALLVVAFGRFGRNCFRTERFGTTVTLLKRLNHRRGRGKSYKKASPKFQAMHIGGGEGNRPPKFRRNSGGNFGGNFGQIKKKNKFFRGSKKTFYLYNISGYSTPLCNPPPSH